MFDQDQEETKEVRPIQYQDVDPFEAGWDTLIAFRSKYRYRVFFENDIGLKNGLQLGILREWLEEKCGLEGEDWEVRMSDQPMEEIWNRIGADDSEAILYGNHVYLTDMSWLVTAKLIQDPNDPNASAEDTKYTSSRITVVQTRK